MEGRERAAEERARSARSGTSGKGLLWRGKWRREFLGGGVVVVEGKAIKIEIVRRVDPLAKLYRMAHWLPAGRADWRFMN
jgi:hypothetical protein